MKTNDYVFKKIIEAIGFDEPLLSTIKKGNLLILATQYDMNLSIKKYCTF